MTSPLFLIGLLVVLAFAAYAFSRASPAAIAAAVRLAGPTLVALCGLALMLAGRAGVGGTLLSLAAAWLGTVRLSQRKKRSAGTRSSVRSAALEMELDHDSGSLEGTVLAGRFEGRKLGELPLDDLLLLHAELAGDEESLQLLETYLDGRFPVWRERVQTNHDRRQRGAPASGPMSEEEAYKILGLEVGASAAEIRKAHRRLMQRLHPDMGGSAFLAARINEARDVLLSDHR